MIRALFLASLLTLTRTAYAGDLPDTVRVATSGTGTRYHAIACAALRGGSTLVYRASADSLGYVPCKRCINPRAAKGKRAPRPVEAR